MRDGQQRRRRRLLGCCCLHRIEGLWCASIINIHYRFFTPDFSEFQHTQFVLSISPVQSSQPASIGRNAQSQRAAVVGCVRGAHRSINPLRIEWWAFCARFIIIRPVVLVHLWVHKYIAGPYLWRFTRRHNVVELSGVEVQAGLIRG